MSAPSQIVVEIDLEDLDIVDREIFRELIEGDCTAESAASRIRRDQYTVRRRMGDVLITALKKQKH